MEVKEIRIEEQKEFADSGVFPFVYSGEKTAPLSVGLQWVKDNKDEIEKLLVKHGAILFRNFPLTGAGDFSDFVDSFGEEVFPSELSAAPRKHVVKNIYTANESPSEAPILFHHEMAPYAHWPKKLFFFGDNLATTGGETPIVLSNEVYKVMASKYPESTEKLEKVGVIYTRVMPPETVATSAQGKGWKTTLNVTTKEDAEKALKAILPPNLAYPAFEWLENDYLKVWNPAPVLAIQTDARTGKKVWFNSIVAIYCGWTDQLHVGPKCIKYGDGTELNHDEMHYSLELMEKFSIDHKWVQGDVLVVDNRTVLHARRPFTGPRRVYTYMTK